MSVIDAVNASHSSCAITCFLGGCGIIGGGCIFFFLLCCVCVVLPVTAKTPLLSQHKTSRKKVICTNAPTDPKTTQRILPRPGYHLEERELSIRSGTLLSFSFLHARTNRNGNGVDTISPRRTEFQTGRSTCIRGCTAITRWDWIDYHLVGCGTSSNNRTNNERAGRGRNN